MTPKRAKAVQSSHPPRSSCCMPFLWSACWAECSHFCAYQLANPLRAAGFDWLYFALFGIIGLMFGVFGSVFNTYAALYKANDNDLLLSLPVPVGSILLSRLLGVYLMGLMFSAVVFVPAATVYLCIDFSVGTLLGCILGMLSISVFAFVLSCALVGWLEKSPPS